MWRAGVKSGQKKYSDDAGNLDPPTSSSCRRKDLGKVSATEESGGKGPAALGYDSEGGYSYGTYQIAASQGSMDSFMNFLNNEKNGYKDFYSQLGGASAVADSKSSANTQNAKNKDYGPFQKRWLGLAESSDQTTKDRFAQAQHDWTQRKHYDMHESYHMIRHSPRPHARKLEITTTHIIIWIIPIVNSYNITKSSFFI